MFEIIAALQGRHMGDMASQVTDIKENIKARYYWPIGRWPHFYLINQLRTLQRCHMSVLASHITGMWNVCSAICQANMTEYIKAVHYWPFVEGNPAVTGGILSTIIWKASWFNIRWNQHFIITGLENVGCNFKNITKYKQNKTKHTREHIMYINYTIYTHISMWCA